MIAGRREYSRWYALRPPHHDNDDPGKQDHSHAYFVDVLEGIVEKMKLVRSTSLTVKKRKKQKANVGTPSLPWIATKHDDKDVPESLHTADKDEEPMPASTVLISHPETTVALPPVLTKPSQYELQAQEEDKVFALWCFLKDIYILRLYLRNLWESYRDGSTSLQLAPSVTDKAFCLNSDAAQDLLADFPGFATVNVRRCG